MEQHPDNERPIPSWKPIPGSETGMSVMLGNLELKVYKDDWDLHSWVVRCPPLIPPTPLEADCQRMAMLKAALKFNDAVCLVKEDIQLGLALGNLACNGGFPAPPPSS
jgi:hypothetical protein